jgi:hypothetical protein
MLTFVSSALRASLHRPKRMLQSKVHLTREPLEGRRKDPAHGGYAAIAGFHPLLGNAGRVGGRINRRGPRARHRRHRCEAARQPLRAGLALGRVAKDARAIASQVHDRWVQSGRPDLRRDLDWRLPRPRASVCREGARRFHAGAAVCPRQAIPWARNRSMPVQELGRGAARSVGRRTDGHGDGEMPLAETTAGSDDRLPGADGRESPAPRDVRGSNRKLSV